MTFGPLLVVLSIASAAPALPPPQSPPPPTDTADVEGAVEGAVEGDGDDDGDDALDGAWLVASEGMRARQAYRASGRINTDLDGVLAIDGGGRALGGRVRFDGAAALYLDVNGTRQDGLRGVHDAAGPLDIVVHTLELGLGGDALVERASVGRLAIDEGVPMTLDGAAVALLPLAALGGGGDVDALLGRTRVFVAGGRTVHFYEAGRAGAELFEDWAIAGGVDVFPAELAKLQLDARALREDTADGTVDTSLGAALFLRTPPLGDTSGQLKLWGRTLDTRVMGFGARAHLGEPDDDAGLDVDTSVQPVTLDELATSFDPYSAVLGPSLPHVRARADAFAQADLFGVARGSLHAGGSARANLNDKDTPFNRSSGRLYLLAQADDLVVDGLFVEADVGVDAALPPAAAAFGGGLGAAAPELADLDGRVALGGAVGWQRRGLRAELGTGWDRYKYTYYRDVNELADVRTVWAALRVRAHENLQVNASGTLEIFDRTIATLQVTLVQPLEVTP